MAAALPAVSPIESRGYAHPEVLVSTDWVAAHRDDPTVRLIESDEDLLLYETGHIPGAIKIDWVTELNDPVTRDYLQRDRFQALLRAKGINDRMTLVFYGDKNNWWATYAFWVFSLFGVPNMKLMDGGRARWVEEGRAMTEAVPSYPAGTITVKDRDDTAIRAFREEVLAHVNRKGQLVDVRSPEEYAGTRMH
ncbi:MAG TPA: rhodanese-like domain-containing protein, partial [Gemmatimonadales bacterium]|nr:rhodanese-like domain-containing protein [Gemmatimonadales bacterium]